MVSLRIYSWIVYSILKKDIFVDRNNCSGRNRSVRSLSEMYSFHALVQWSAAINPTIQCMPASSHTIGSHRVLTNLQDARICPILNQRRLLS